MAHGELFHSTPLRPAEYLLGKFLGALTPIAAAMVIHVALTMFFQYSLPRSRGEEIRGPFAITHYLRPLLLFAIPNLLAVGGLAFALGIFTRRPILVFLLPVALIMGCGFFLWSYSPAGMYPPLNRILMFLDPCGFRWLYQTWLKSDRGVDFYNNSPIPLDRLILGNRLFFLGIAGAAFALALARFTRTIRGADGCRSSAGPRRPGAIPPPPPRSWLRSAISGWRAIVPDTWHRYSRWRGSSCASSARSRGSICSFR